MTKRRPRVVVVGGGFGGLAAAKALRHAPVDVILLDRTNHHLFQPLLYQVATAVLTPGQIGSPIRGILRHQKNTTVALGEVTAVNTEQRSVLASVADRSDVVIWYDYLIVATGARQSYFGHDEYERFAPGLKSLADAVAIRSRILQVFEQAETEEDPGRHRDLLTFVLVGAGPTGVEMASAIATMARTTLRSEFRRIDPLSTRIVLVDMANRVLGSFSEDLSRAATHRLERLGVELRLGQGVDLIDAQGVVVGGERIAASSVIWTAGVAIGRRTMAGGRDRSCRASQGAARSHRARTSRNLRGGRHCLAAAGRKAAAGGCPGRDAGGTICRRSHSASDHRRAGLASVPLLRQGKHGGREQRVRRSRDGEDPDEWLFRVAGLGRSASRVSGHIQPSRERLRSMGMDLSDGSTWLASDRDLRPVRARCYRRRVCSRRPACDHRGRIVDVKERALS